MDVTLDVAGATHDLHLARRQGGYDVQAGGETLGAELQRNGSGVLVRVDGRTVHVELVRPGEAAGTIFFESHRQIRIEVRHSSSSQ